MGKEDFSGMRRFQPDPKSSKELKRKPESPKKRAVGWVDTEGRSKSSSVSPKKLILPPSSCVKDARTERWVEESVRVTSQILERSREDESDEEDGAGAYIEHLDTSGSSDDEDLLAEQRKRSEEAKKVMKTVAKAKKVVAVAHVSSASRSKEPVQAKASRKKEGIIQRLPVKYLCPRREGQDEKEENWVYWRLCSSEVDLALDKHRSERNRYLTAELVKDIFRPPGLTFSAATASVMLRVTKVPELFFFGNAGRKRLAIAALLFPTSENRKIADRDEIKASASGSLASLLKSEVQEGDLLIIFVQNGPRFSQFIPLNSSFRGQETTHVVHYRRQSADSVRAEDYTFASEWRLKVESSWLNDKVGTVMIRPLKPNDFHADSSEEEEEDGGEQMNVDSSASTVESKSEADPNDPNPCEDEPVDNDQLGKQQAVTESQKPPESSDPSSRTTLPSSQASKESSGGGEAGPGVQFHPDAFEQSVTAVTQKQTQANLPGVSQESVVEVAVENDDIVAEADNFSVYSQPAALRFMSQNKEPSSQLISDIPKASDEEPVAKKIASTSELVPVPKPIDILREQPSSSAATRKLPSSTVKTVKLKPTGVLINKDNTEPAAQVLGSHRSAINTCDLYVRRFTQSSFDEINQDLCRETQFSSNNIVDRIFENVCESPENVTSEDPSKSSNVPRTEANLHGNNHDVSVDLNTQSNVQEIHLETQSFPLDCFDDDHVCDESIVGKCSNGTITEHGDEDDLGPEKTVVDSSNPFRKSEDAGVPIALTESGRKRNSCRIA